MDVRLKVVLEPYELKSKLLKRGWYRGVYRDYYGAKYGGF